MHCFTAEIHQKSPLQSSFPRRDRGSRGRLNKAPFAIQIHFYTTVISAANLALVSQRQ